MKYSLDANCWITAWDIYYPRKTFPSLWEKLVEKKELIVTLKLINGEILNQEIRSWLKTNYFSVTETLKEEDELLSLELQGKYQIANIKKGASRNDISLIAWTKRMGPEVTVVTYEKVQTEEPKNMTNYKIPLICKKEGVRCIDFITMVSELKISI